MHVPFCTRRCAYCDFATAVYEPATARRYVQRLLAELETVPARSVLDTVYVGGGTPSALPLELAETLLGAIRDRLAAAPEEWTVEANPETVDPGRARLWRSAGVDRVSLGNQSFQPRVLAALGREHVPRHTRAALEVLRGEGFHNLNVDLMFGAPGQTVAELEADVAELAALDVPHVSAYCLAFEEGTPLTRRLAQGRVGRLPEDAELDQFRAVRRLLEAAGLRRYEISNFARPGFESRHNRVYWWGEEYHGVGLSAGSYVGGVRRTNTRSLARYLGPWDGPRPPHEAEALDPAARARETVILALRLAEGLSEARLVSRSGFSLERLYPGGELERLAAAGLLRRAGGRLRLTARGFELADSVFVELV